MIKKDAKSKNVREEERNEEQKPNVPCFHDFHARKERTGEGASKSTDSELLQNSSFVLESARSRRNRRRKNVGGSHRVTNPLNP